MAILTSGSNVTYKTQWFDGEWVDGIQDFWDDFTSDGLLEKETVSDSVGCEFAQFHNFSFLKEEKRSDPSEPGKNFSREKKEPSNLSLHGISLTG